MCDHVRMTDRPGQRPEGRIIAVAQKRARLSGREAARRAGLSEGHWRSIVSGARSVGTDTWIPVRGPAETLARMAQVVGVTPEELEDAGRADAAAELRELPPLTKASEGDRVEELERRMAAMEAELERIRRGQPEIPSDDES